MKADQVSFTHPWIEKALGEVGTVVVGGTPSTAVATYWGGEIPWMASGDVHGRRVEDVPGRITRTGLEASNATLVDPPAVAVGLAGQGKTRGTTALVLRRLCTNQSVALIRGDNVELRTEYLFHNLDLRYRELRARSAGGGRAGLSKAILENVPIPLPTMGEQRRIAQILDTVDEAIRATARLIEKLKALKAGLLHDLLTRGIDENGRLRDPIAHPEQFKETPIGLRPATWKLVRLDDFERAGNVQLGRGNVISHPDMEATPGDYPVYSSAATNNGQIGQYGKYMFDEALITWSVDGGGALFFRAKHKFSVTNVCGFLRIQNPIVEYRFLHAALVWQHERLTFDYTTKAHPSVIRQLYWVPVAPLAEQRKIGELLDRVDGSLAAEMRAAEKLRLLKRGLMNDLLTGKVRVLIHEEGDDE